MQDKYTKYLVQSKNLKFGHDDWYTVYRDIDSLEEAQEAIELYRETHIFQIVKRDYETIDTIINEQTS